MSQRRWLATAVIFRPSDMSLGFAETWTVIAPATAETLEGGSRALVATQASDQATAMERLTNCIVKIRDWMASNRLKLNEDKTQVIWLGARHQLSKLTENTLTLPNATVQFSTVVNDLGVQIDSHVSQLSISNHIAKLSRSCFFHLRQLRLIGAYRTSLTRWRHCRRFMASTRSNKQTISNA